MQLIDNGFNLPMSLLKDFDDYEISQDLMEECDKDTTLFYIQEKNDPDEIYFCKRFPIGLGTEKNLSEAKKLLIETEKFFNEAATQANLKHPNILNVQGFFLFFPQDPANPKSQKDFCPALMTRVLPSDLYELLQEETLPNEIKTEYAFIIADILDYLQQNNLVHGDIKPDNFLVDTNQKIYLIDFGSSRIIGKPSGPGTRYYKAPENLLNKSVANPSYDVFSFGVVLLNLISNNCDISQIVEMENTNLDTPEKIVDALKAASSHSSPSIYKLVNQCIEFDPKKRPKPNEIKNEIKSNKASFSDDQYSFDDIINSLESEKKNVLQEKEIKPFPKEIKDLMLTFNDLIAILFIMLGIVQPIDKWLSTINKLKSYFKGSNECIIPITNEIFNLKPEVNTIEFYFNSSMFQMNHSHAITKKMPQRPSLLKQLLKPFNKAENSKPIIPKQPIVIPDKKIGPFNINSEITHGDKLTFNLSQHHQFASIIITRNLMINLKVKIDHP